MAANIGKRLIPLLDRVLVERFIPETRTKGGIMLPEKSLNKVQSATVVAVGPGARTEKGDVIAPSVKEGDKVLLPEYGGTKVEIGEKILKSWANGAAKETKIGYNQFNYHNNSHDW